MTGWDHHDHGPDHDPGQPDWPALGSEPAAHLDPSGPDDYPYGSPGEPGPEPNAADPAADHEPAGLPEEQPADWSGWDPDAGEPGAFHDAVPAADLGAVPDGTDPVSWADAAGADPFPPALDVDVQPDDGGPWVDPGLLGGPDHWTADPGAPVDPPAALLPDLAAADGDPDAGWDTLRDSDDPAVRALTRLWNP
jgi:hypothetical protein